MGGKGKNILVLAVELVLIAALCAGSFYFVANGFFDKADTETINSKGVLTWPEDQFLPHLNETAEVLDYYVESPHMATDIMMVSLKGIVNKTKPRIYTAESDPEEQGFSWVDLLQLKLNKVGDCKYDLIEKYKDEIKGIVIYDTSNVGVSHTINLATTIAGVESTLIVGPDILDEFRARFSEEEIPTFLDTRELNFNNMWDVYKYQYDHYNDKTVDRIMVGVSPVPNDMDSGLITGKIRDYAIAIGANVVFLDPETPRDAELLDKFLVRMKSGISSYMGWWPQENKGVDYAGQRGVVTLAADYSNNLSVYAGMQDPNKYAVPELKKAEKPELENKFYIALCMADGDNMQYCEGKFRSVYIQPERGTVPISYTFAPAMYDVAKPLVKYLYENATLKDNFICGPSAYGYFYPKHVAGYTNGDDQNDENNKWNNYKDLEKLLKLSNSYMEKMSMRAITVWNWHTAAMDRDMAEYYADNMPYLYGITQQENMKDGTAYLYKYDDRDFLVRKMEISYASEYQQMIDDADARVRNFTGDKPQFYAMQGVPWGIMGRVDKYVDLYWYFSMKSPYVEFVTLDQLIQLQTEYMNKNNLEKMG